MPLINSLMTETPHKDRISESRSGDTSTDSVYPFHNPRRSSELDYNPEISANDLYIIRNFLIEERPYLALEPPLPPTYSPPRRKRTLNRDPLINDLLIINLTSFLKRHDELIAESNRQEVQNFNRQTALTLARQKQELYEQRLRLLERGSLLIGGSSLAMFIGLIIYSFLTKPANAADSFFIGNLTLGVTLSACILTNRASSLIRHNLPRFLSQPLPQPPALENSPSEEESIKNLQLLSLALNRSSKLLRREHLLDLLGPSPQPSSSSQTS